MPLRPASALTKTVAYMRVSKAKNVNFCPSVASIRVIINTILQVKQSHYSPGQALRVPVGWGSQISRQSTHECDKIVSPTHWPSLTPPKKYSWYSFLLEAESTPMAIVRPEGLCQWKIPKTPMGFEPATFRLVAQCLNQLRHLVPQLEVVVNGNMSPSTPKRHTEEAEI